MATRLFGTDGVRGKAARIPWIMKRCAASAPPSCARCRTRRARPHRARHARVGRLDRAGARARRPCLRSRGRERRRRPDARCGVPHAFERLHGRGRDLGLAQPVEDTASRCSRAAARSSPRSSSGTSRRLSPTCRGGSAGEADAVQGEALVDRYVAHVLEVLPDAGALRGARIAIDCANGATTPWPPCPPRGRPRRHRDRHEPDGRTSTCTALDAPRASRAPRRGRGVPGGWPSTATATGPSRGRAGRIVDGDAVMLMCARQLKFGRPAEGRAVVATVMSNIGLEIASASRGVLVCCQVGDK